MNILEEIAARYEGFSRTRKRICDHILSEPEQCCFCSLRSFAKKVDATEVTVLNFCRALGLGSYLELKKALQDYVILKVSPQKRLQLAAAGSGSAGELYARMERVERETVQTTFERNDAGAAVRFAEQICRAERVYIVAHNFSRVAAEYLHYRLCDLNIDSCVLDMENHRDVFNQVSRAPAKSLLVAVAIPPYGTETVALTRYCTAIGMPVAVLTDRASSPVAQDAVAALYCHVELLGLTNSFTAMLGIIDTVSLFCSYVAEADAEGAVEARIAMREQFDDCFRRLS